MLTIAKDDIESINSDTKQNNQSKIKKDIKAKKKRKKALGLIGCCTNTMYNYFNFIMHEVFILVFIICSCFRLNQGNLSNLITCSFQLTFCFGF